MFMLLRRCNLSLVSLLAVLNG